MRDRTEALLHIAIAVAANYRREKLERGLLDYDDLIDKTLALLASGASAWVHYKLDRGVDHVLIDEAQDTSPRQWDIIAHIISEFTTGAGARDGADAHHVRGRRREAVDLLLSGRGTAGVRCSPVGAEEEIRRGGAEVRVDPVHLFIPVGTGDPQSVDHVFRDEAIYRSIQLKRPIRCMKRCPMPVQARSTSGSFRSPTTSRTSRAGARRSMACR